MPYTVGVALSTTLNNIVAPLSNSEAGSAQVETITIRVLGWVLGGPKKGCFPLSMVYLYQ